MVPESAASASMLEIQKATVDVLTKVSVLLGVLIPLPEDSQMGAFRMFDYVLKVASGKRVYKSKLSAGQKGYVMIYKNPIIRGFNPDPSICRVGCDYYLVTSSFEYFPGIPIYHSSDLINWTMINHCISNPRQLDYKIFGNSGGIWAPTIRYHNGRFYVTATVDKLGNMIMHTDDINGEWFRVII